MDIPFYLDQFQQAADRLDKKALDRKQLESAVVLYADSVVLKLYKRAWSNPGQDPLTSASRIFFSVWLSDAGIAGQKIFYNIHALKLRKLAGYSIQSRQFAERFRTLFKPFEPQWDNVSVSFGPLTLMEGWLLLVPENLHADIINLANLFLEVEPLVDETLLYFKNKQGN